MTTSSCLKVATTLSRVRTQSRLSSRETNSNAPINLCAQLTGCSLDQWSILQSWATKRGNSRSLLLLLMEITNFVERNQRRTMVQKYMTSKITHILCLLDLDREMEPNIHGQLESTDLCFQELYASKIALHLKVINLNAKVLRK